MIKVERRTPFGFKGDWGVLYKLYTYDDVQDGVLQYQNHNYLKVSTKVQFKTLTKGGKMRYNAQIISNLLVDATRVVVETTDAYFDTASKTHKCVVEEADIINLRGEWWEVEKVDIDIVYTPARQEHYFCTLRQIKAGVIKW